MKLISLFLLSVFVFLACGNPKPGDANEQVAAEDEVCETDLVTATYADSVNNGLYAADSLRKSVERETRFSLNDHSVTVKYSSPGVRGREIWGKLVPYDKVWAAGAHVATSIELSKSITIAGNELEEGKYAIFMIPGRDSWTVIVNRNFNQHMSDDYDEKEDVFRVEIAPDERLRAVQRLTYDVIKDSDTDGLIRFSWEKLYLDIPFSTTG